MTRGEEVMSDSKTAPLEDQERFRSPYEHVQEMIQKVKPFVKEMRLVRLPKRRDWHRYS